MVSSELLRTNPVLAIQQAQPELASSYRMARAPAFDEPLTQLARRGQRLPASVVARWKEQGWISEEVASVIAGQSRPGVCGLAVEKFVDGVVPQGCVVPLEVAVSRRWRINNSRLPLELDRLARILIDVLGFAGHLVPGVVPEARAFAIDSAFRNKTRGASMDVAAVLAIVRHVAGEPAQLDRACAVVETDGPTMESVGQMETKLEAFGREHGQGTLLVRRAGCEIAARFDQRFDEVWPVETLADLAGHLADSGLLDAWRVPQPLEIDALKVVDDRLGELGHDHRRIVDLAKRVLECGWSDRVPAAVRGRFQLHQMRSLRHMGRYQEALEVAETRRSSLRAAGDGVCDEQLAEADLQLASGLYDTAAYRRLWEELEPHVAVIEDAPRRYSPELRVKMWNTAARALSRLGDARWEALLDRSLDLQKRTDPANIPRTQNYRIEGLLHAGRLQDADEAIASARRARSDEMSRVMLSFYAADLARRRGQQEVDGDLEKKTPTKKRDNHPLGFYFQATARQQGRSRADAAARFTQAAACFAMDAEASGAANVLWVYAHACRLAAAICMGACLEEPRQDLVGALAQPGLEQLKDLAAADWGEGGQDRMVAIFDVLPGL